MGKQTLGTRIKVTKNIFVKPFKLNIISMLWHILHFQYWWVVNHNQWFTAAVGVYKNICQSKWKQLESHLHASVNTNWWWISFNLIMFVITQSFISQYIPQHRQKRNNFMHICWHFLGQMVSQNILKPTLVFGWQQRDTPRAQ